jgi:hypothetical protein
MLGLLFSFFFFFFFFFSFFSERRAPVTSSLAESKGPRCGSRLTKAGGKLMRLIVVWMWRQMKKPGRIESLFSTCLFSYIEPSYRLPMKEPV